MERFAMKPQRLTHRKTYLQMLTHMALLEKTQHNTDNFPHLSALYCQLMMMRNKKQNKECKAETILKRVTVAIGLLQGQTLIVSCLTDMQEQNVRHLKCWSV